MTTITTSITEQKKIDLRMSHTKKSNNNKMTTTMTVSKKELMEAEGFNVTTCGTTALNECKAASYHYPLGLPQIMNYPFMLSSQGWLSMSDSSINNFKAHLNEYPVKKQHLYKAYTVIETGQRLKTVWDAEEERFKCWRKGKWVYIVGTEELCYNIKMLHKKKWNIHKKWINCHNAALVDKNYIYNSITDDIEKNRTGNADGRARKVKNSKTVQVYKS